MRPSGLGLRLISLQLQPGLAFEGERCPFIAFPFGVIGGGLFAEDATNAFAAVRPLTFRTLIGLLLFDLALLNSALGSSSSPNSSSIGTGDVTLFFAADLVTGPKYPSCDPS